MELAVVNSKGQDTGKKVTLNAAIFGVEPNDHAIYLDVKQYLANQRQGTHKSKQRNEIAGSTKKLKRQKGTGGARAGAITSPLFVGGGRVFGPVPRDYNFKLNKKLKQVARKSALTYKAQGEMIKVLDELVMDAPKTKEMISLAKNLQISDKKLLIIVPESNNNVSLSSRNLKDVKVLTASNVNTYDVMNASNVVIVEQSLQVLDEMFGL